MKDQINASKILHSSAIYTQSMKITRPLCKKLLMIKSVNNREPKFARFWKPYFENKWL